MNPYVTNMLAWNLYELGRAKIAVHPPATYDDHPIHIARNQAVEDFLTTQADYLFFYDSDIILHPMAILKLLELKVPVASGWYIARKNKKPAVYVYAEPEKVPRYVKFPPPTIPKYRPLTIQEIVNAKYESVVYPKIHVDAVGAGCLLIRRDVFQKIKKPWFYFHPEGKYGEDLYFCYNARLAGYKIAVRPDVHCEHIHWIKLGWK